MEDWWTVNSMLVSWMLNAIEPNLRLTMSISYMEIAKDVWDDINESFYITTNKGNELYNSSNAGPHFEDTN